MKKVVIVLLIFVMIILFPKEKVEHAFKESINGYYKYELIFENRELSTFNFEEYLKDYKILTIFPSIPTIYKNKITFNSYSFNPYQTMSWNIARFEEKYIASLEDLGYRKEAVKVRTNGLIIDKIIIYSEEKAITKLKNYFPNLQYQLLESLV